MQLLAPLFLLGLALIALPFWLHRLKTETPDTKAFASSMFLQPSEDPVHVRRKLRYIVLLSLRVLFLLLLALAFSRPFWPTTETAAVTDWNNLHLIVIDSSASMASKDKQAKTRQALIEIINNRDQNEAIQLFSIDRNMQKLSEIELQSAPVLSAFDNIEITDLALRYDAVARSVETLMSADQNADTNYQIHFISDFQQSSMPSRFADLIPEPSSTVSYQLFTHNISAETTANINLAIDQVEIIGQAARIGVRSYAETSEDDGQVIEFAARARLNDQPWRDAEGEIDLNGRATVSIDGFEFLPQQNQLQVEIIIDDDLVADNMFYHVVNRSAPEPLLLLTDKPNGSSALYVSALFADQDKLSGGQNNFGLNYSAQTELISSFDARTLNRYSWVLIDDVGSIDSNLASELLSYITEGGSIFIASSDNAESLQSLPLFSLEVSQQTDLAQLSSDKKTFRSIASIDHGHQALNQLTGWNELRFERWLNLTNTDNTDVLLQLEGGVPLLIEKQLGRGKLMLLTSSIDNQWNNLPVKPIFVALLRNVAQYLSGAELIGSAAYAGDTLDIQGDTIGAGQLIDPQGNAVLALGDRLQSGRLTMDQLGFYQASTAAGNYVIAVNLPPSESAVTSVSSQSLEQWQDLAKRSFEKSSSQVDSPSQQQNAIGADQYYTELWHWLLILAAIAVVLETLLANFKLASNSRLIQTNQNIRKAREA